MMHIILLLTAHLRLPERVFTGYLSLAVKYNSIAFFHVV